MRRRAPSSSVLGPRLRNPARGNGTAHRHLAWLGRVALGPRRPGARARRARLHGRHCRSTPATTYRDPAEPGPTQLGPAPGRGQPGDRPGGRPSHGWHRTCGSTRSASSAGPPAATPRSRWPAASWSPSRFRDHCLQPHRSRTSPPASASPPLRRGDGLDAIKAWAARLVIRAQVFRRRRRKRHTDPRVGAAVAMVPFAADFDPESLRRPRRPAGTGHRGPGRQPGAPLPRGGRPGGLRAAVRGGGSAWPKAGHGAMLSPTAAAREWAASPSGCSAIPPPSIVRPTMPQLACRRRRVLRATSQAGPVANFGRSCGATAVVWCAALFCTYPSTRAVVTCDAPRDCCRAATRSSPSRPGAGIRRPELTALKRPAGQPCSWQ
jgi:hypothetical protein